MKASQKDQLERLRRHYESSVTKYDLPSFLDLASILRIWAEDKGGETDKYKKLSFKKIRQTKTMKSIFSGSEFIYINLPGGVTSSAAAKSEFKRTDLMSGPQSNNPFSASVHAKVDDEGNLTVNEFFIVGRELSEYAIKGLNIESKKVPIETVNFSDYMESPTIYFKLINHEPRQITNKLLIQRIANEYGGSHTEDSDYALDNNLSEPVKIFMQYSCANLPLPYFILLYIAKNIITNFD